MDTSSPFAIVFMANPHIYHRLWHRYMAVASFLPCLVDNPNNALGFNSTDSIGSNIAPICRMAIRMTAIIPFFRSADNRNIKQNSLPGFPLTKRLILCQHNTNRCACADVRRLVFGYLRIAKDGIIIDTAISAAINFFVHLLPPPFFASKLSSGALS